MSIDRNQIRTIHKLLHGSDRYGNCEVCMEPVETEIFVYEKFPLRVKDTGAVFLGEAVFSQYGHRECLEDQCGKALEKSHLKLIGQAYYLPDKLLVEFRAQVPVKP